MNKVQIAALMLAAIGVYSFISGKSGVDTASLINTWAPIAAAAYLMFA